MSNNPIWDSIGSIVIGVLMGGVATFLIRMNRSFLIGHFRYTLVRSAQTMAALGRSISSKEISLILKQLKEDPVVKVGIWTDMTGVRQWCLCSKCMTARARR